MKEFPFPVRVVGAGSQPTEEEELQYLPMPREMNTFRMPLVPEDADAAALRGARDVLAEFLERLIAWDPAAQGRGPNLDLEGLPSAVLRIVNDMLGDGEVSIRSDGTHRFRIQESVFTGVWRVCRLDDAGSAHRQMRKQAIVVAARTAGGVPIQRRYGIHIGHQHQQLDREPWVHTRLEKHLAQGVFEPGKARCHIAKPGWMEGNSASSAQSRPAQS